MSARYGERVEQIGGYTAYIPKSLDAYDISLEPLVPELSAADRALARLDATTEFLPNPELFVRMYVRKEAVLSAQIEGTRASMLDVVDEEAGSEPEDKRDDLREVKNYMDALEYGIQQLDDLPISRRLICKIHERLLEGVRGQNLAPGRLRDDQNYISSPGGGIEDAVHVPPPPDRVADLVHDLASYINEEVSHPVLIRAALAHQQFETIHPFLDGNGRLGRLLVSLMLIEQGALQQPILYLSAFFRRRRQEYYDRLQAVRDDGELKQWIEFFLEAVRDVAEHGTQTARRIRELREEHRELVTAEISSPAKALTLLEALFQHPAVTVPQVKQIIEMSYPVANDLVADFERLGLLTEVTGQKRNRRYRYQPYLKIFGELAP